MRRLTRLIVGLILTLWCGGALADDAPVTYKIEAVRDGIYRLTAGNYRSVFVVTEDGVVVTDPLNEAAARWLKAEIKARFDRPIRYVIYSHSHPDHAYGGEVFRDPGVVFISHRMARDALKRSRAKTALPDLVFDDHMTVRLGDQVIDLRYHGPNNGYGSISMHFPRSRVLYVVDWIVLGRMPYRDLQGYDLQGMLMSTEAVLRMDFDRFIGGHAEMGSKADVRRYLRYIEALYGEVLSGIEAGKPLAQIQAEADLSAFSDLKMYEAWRALNIAGAHRELIDKAYMQMRPEIPKPAQR